ncbi:MAG: 50S ribosomal protein L18 [Ignavibacteriae bacterium]|nr:50S ribosomal protein L18 [Ignavibacteriota bacterium]MCB9210027.1 50S ribosomal protein L18 [Ignavibacteriales bacterium]MCB9218588.1 50S ribosomal protein L18 [Ignavibacteriales bacterium]MCB9259406.1 50S ribosomal protein L18 [Ignavibacteriales bacterium]
MRNKRLKNKIRIRKKISGTSERPRIAVYKSLKQIYAQIIDDTKGETLISASSLSKDIEAEIKSAKSKLDKSKVVGKFLAEKAKDKGINSVVFDRSGYRYHGRIKAIADGAREGGLSF